jgi:hypothetical protein
MSMVCPLPLPNVLSLRLADTAPKTRSSTAPHSRNISSTQANILPEGYGTNRTSAFPHPPVPIASLLSRIRHPDAYHTLYCLSGLSAAQHRVVHSPARRAEIRHAWKDTGGKFELLFDMKLVEGADVYVVDETLDALRKAAFAESLSWIEEEGTSSVVGGAQNRVASLSRLTHPLAHTR